MDNSKIPKINAGSIISLYKTRHRSHTRVTQIKDCFSQMLGPGARGGAYNDGLLSWTGIHYLEPARNVLESLGMRDVLTGIFRRTVQDIEQVWMDIVVKVIRS